MPFDDDVSWAIMFGRAILLLVILYFSSVLVFSSTPWIFLDGVNLLIHESGHLVFQFGGETISILGGTIMQLLMPSMFLFYFLRKDDLFSGSFCLFWLGDNLINVSVYIKDARSMVMPLVGGGVHDWNILLSKWQLLEEDQLVGNIFRLFGITFIVISIVLMIFILLIDISKKLSISNEK